MGLKAYLMVNVKDDMKQSDFIQTLRELEETPEIVFVDPVVGSKDLVIMVDAPVSLESIIKNISNYSWVNHVEILRIVSLFERHLTTRSQVFKALGNPGIPQTSLS